MSVQHVKNRPIVIGLTGSIASGKSTASNYFKKINIPVIDSDEIVKRLWIDNQEMLQKIKETFHTLNKKEIAQLIFSNKKAQQAIESIVHPYVFETIKKQRLMYEHQPLIVIDMPLLFEVNYDNEVDYTALVYADEQTAIKRLMMRDQLTNSEAKKRLASQMPIDLKKERADFILDNTHDQSRLYQTIDHMLRSIRHEK